MAASDDFTEPLLTTDEVTELADRIEAGLFARVARVTGAGFADASEAELLAIEERGELARQRFIRANLRLVAMVSRQTAGRAGLAEADLFQEGCVGLIAAVERFDHRRGHKFSTYALFWIRAYVNVAAAAQLGAIQLPTTRVGQLRSARGVEVDLSQHFGRVATVTEVADALGRSETWTAGLLAHQAPQSLESLDPAALDRLHGRDEFDAVLSHQLQIEDLLDRLGALDRQVLELRLGLAGGEPCSYAETARRLAITVTRVRRTEARALETLRGICPQQASVHL